MAHVFERGSFKKRKASSYEFRRAVPPATSTFAVPLPCVLGGGAGRADFLWFPAGRCPGPLYVFWQLRVAMPHAHLLLQVVSTLPFCKGEPCPGTLKSLNFKITNSTRAKTHMEPHTQLP